ncbi:UDP-N-acetylmuramyl-tripeptide synthetase [Proteinivorax tanatarense]|uniref:UDP-N-acetylmuramyl-tripeptide synthetase n=1 Tax=Proteinivorax tanatarense TaxID=1260629 RepID=A0AAU7VL93_9FIRM
MYKGNIINELLEIIDTHYSKPFNFKSIQYHSGKVKPGDIFVCIKGYRVDGHKYISHAIENGAVAIIVEEKQQQYDIPQFVVSNPRLALAKISDFINQSPSKDLTMVGITASNGKTTTSFMVDSVLSHSEHNTGLIGTVVVKYADQQIPADLTTPESLELQTYLRKMKEKNVDYVTMEVSSAAQELDRVAYVDYDIFAFNNLTPEHIDFHGSYENYIYSKTKVLRKLCPSKIAIFNIDCQDTKKQIHQTKAKVITSGVQSKDAMVTIHNLDLTTGKASFTVNVNKPLPTLDGNYIQPTSFDISLNVLGLHSVYNSLTAIIIGLINNITPKKIEEALQKFKGVERRFELIYNEEFKILDDHFANSANIDVTLKTLDYMKYNQLHLIYAIRGNRGVDVNRESGEAILKWAKKLSIDHISVSLSKDYVGVKDKVSTSELEAFSGIMEQSDIKVSYYNSLEDAVVETLQTVKDDDVVLLAGAQGMDPGGKIALEYLYTRKVAEGTATKALKEKIDAILKERVAGL